MVEAVNVMVSVGKVQVKPGDILVGDDSGVVVVPREKAEAVLKVALEIDEAETRIEEAFARDDHQGSAGEVRYHSLQNQEMTVSANSI